MLAMSESRSDSDSKNSSYQRRLKPSKSCSERLELKENNTTSTIGANRKRKKTPVKSLRKRGRSKSLGGFAGAPAVGAGGRRGLRDVDAHAGASLASRAAARR